MAYRLAGLVLFFEVILSSTYQDKRMELAVEKAQPKECPICLCEFDTLMFIQACRHEFCEECIVQMKTLTDRIRDKPLEVRCAICRKYFSGSFNPKNFVQGEDRTFVLESALETEYPIQQKYFELGWVLDSDRHKVGPIERNLIGSNEVGTFIDPNTTKPVALAIGNNPMSMYLADSIRRRELLDLGRSPRIYPLTFDGRYFTCLWQEDRQRSPKGIIVIDREANRSNYTKKFFPLIIFSDKNEVGTDCVRFVDEKVEHYPKALIGEDWTTCGSVAFKGNQVFNPFTCEIMQLWDGAVVQSVDAWTCCSVVIAKLANGFVRLPML